MATCIFKDKDNFQRQMNFLFTRKYVVFLFIGTEKINSRGGSEIRMPLKGKETKEAMAGKGDLTGL